jgi:hypothetical protein
MSILRFYDNFAAAYGTCWLALAVPACFTGRIHIDRIGFYGFLAAALAYAVFRLANDAIKRFHSSEDLSGFD